MSEQHYREKEEEKEHEKQSEKQEKDMGEKWRRDPLSAIVWAAIFVWAGIVLLVYNLGQGVDFVNWFDRVGLDPWSIVLIGAGLIVFLEAAVRMLVPAYRRPIGGTLIFAGVLVMIGLGMIWDWDRVWPIILIVIGVGIFLGGFLRRR